MSECSGVDLREESDVVVNVRKWFAVVGMEAGRMLGAFVVWVVFGLVIVPLERRIVPVR